MEMWEHVLRLRFHRAFGVLGSHFMYSTLFWPATKLWFCCRVLFVFYFSVVAVKSTVMEICLQMRIRNVSRSHTKSTQMRQERKYRLIMDRLVWGYNTPKAMDTKKYHLASIQRSAMTSLFVHHGVYQPQAADQQSTRPSPLRQKAYSQHICLLTLFIKETDLQQF